MKTALVFALFILSQLIVVGCANRIRAHDNDALKAAITIKVYHNNEEWFRKLLGELSDKDEDVRRKAADGLARIEDKRAVLPLIKLLADREDYVRLASVEALGYLKDERAVEPLIEILRDEQWVYRYQTKEALVRIGKSAVDSLNGALKSSYVGVRRGTALALSRIGDKKAVGPLRESWKNDNDEIVRVHAAYGLAKIAHDEEAFQYIIEVLKTKYGDGPRIAAEVVGDIGDARAVGILIDTLKSRDDFLNANAANALVRIGKPAFDSLVQALNSKNENVRIRAVYALGQIGGERAFKFLVKMLKDEDWDVRRHAAWALGDIGDKRAVEPLIRVLDDKGEGVCAAVVYTLGKIGDKSTADRLFEIIKGKQSNVRLAIAFSLAEIGDKRATPYLVEGLKHKETMLLSDIAEALGKTGDTRAVEPLLDLAFNEQSWSNRAAAARALGNIGDKRAIETLKKLWKDDKDRLVRQSAVCGLCNIIVLDNAYEDLTRAAVACDYRAQHSAARALAKMGDRKAIEQLIKVLDHSDRFVRRTAADVLGEIAEKSAIKPLIEVLRGKDSQVRSSAVKALIKITSQDFGEDYEKWKEWYKKNR